MTKYEVDGRKLENQIAYREALLDSRSSNAYKSWEPQDNQELMMLMNSLNINQLAKQLKRKPGAIRSRIKKLNLNISLNSENGKSR